MTLILFSIVFLFAFIDLAKAAAVDIPLCGSSHGFASDINSEFTLVPNVEIDRSKGESLILAVRPIPYNPNMPAAVAQAIIDAWYVIGNETFRLTSDSDGLVSIGDPLPKGTAIQIAIRNARIDGISPFVLYSYVANRPHCYLNIGPRNAFLGPVPGNAQGRPASLYFSSTPPSGMSAGVKAAFRFGVIDGTPVSVWYSHSDADMKAGRRQQLNIASETLWSLQTPVYIEVRPLFEGPRTLMMRAVVEWRLIEGSEEPNVPGRYEEEGDNVPLAGGSGVAPQGTAVGTKVASIGLLTWTLLSICCYFVVRSVYNYRVHNVRSFPEFVPHHEVFASAFESFRETAVALKSKASRSRGGYAGVNSAEDDV